MNILLVGAGGYASNYIDLLLKQTSEDVVWVGVVEPYLSSCQYREQVEAARIPIYPTMEAFFACHQADLAVICTPTFLHCEQSIYALSQGCNVLCEKPVAPTVAEAKKMLEAEQKYNRFIAVGYQWSYSDAMQALKKDVLRGVFGEANSLKTAISWPRQKSYYQRGCGWAGKIQKDGRMILDSIASNACSHYLHNMFFLLGDCLNTSDFVAEFQAECYRANDIETFDTCCIKMKTKKGADLYFAATHAAREERNPEFVYTFQKGKVCYAQDGEAVIVAQMEDGSKKIYGDPFAHTFKKFWDCIEATKNGTVPICTVETALPHVQLIESIYQTTPVKDFPAGVCDDTDMFFVEGLSSSLWKAYEQSALLSQIEVV